MALVPALYRASALHGKRRLVHFNTRRMIGSVSAIDSVIFRNLFGTDEIRKVKTHYSGG